VKYIEFEINTGKKNMQIDSDLLDFAIKNKLKEPIFRLYGWSPACVSLGRNQNDNFLDKDFLTAENIDVVRRLTGGRALLHDKEITYSYICPVSSLKNDENIIESYKEISQILIDGFKSLGINLEFFENKCSNAKINYCMCLSTVADLSLEGKKLVGSAQFRKEGYILQHGSILFDYNKELIEKIFNEKTDEKNITCLSKINPSITVNDVRDALKKSLLTYNFRDTNITIQLVF
jgi:lipoyl(octanoyl) transferase